MKTQTQTAAHTPGPWHSALKDTVKDDHWAHIENGKRLVAFAYGHDQESKANARLIAAAPDGLNAAEYAKTALAEAIKQLRSMDCPAHAELCQRALDAVVAFLVKAKG